MTRKLCLLALGLLACTLVGRGSPAPATPRPALYANTEPAPGGSVLRVLVDPDQIVGWIAGSMSFAGRHATVRIAGETRDVAIGDDNTFALPYRVAEPTDAVVSVGTLAQTVTLAPRDTAEPTALFVVDRSAYRPGDKLQFAAFLKRLDGAAFRPITGDVEVKIVSATKQTTAAKLALVADADGRIAGDYTFSQADPLDDYVLSIPGYRGTARVTLAAHRKSKVKLDVDAVVGRRDAKLVFRALDFRDEAVPGGSVALTAQIVRDARAASTDFVYGGPNYALDRNDRVAFAAIADADELPTGAAQVVASVKATVALDGNGTGAHALPIQTEWLRGGYSVLVDAVILDANGREQRTTRSLPLGRRDVRLELDAPAEIVAASQRVDVGVRVVDEGGRAVAATTTVVATRAEATESVAFDWEANNIYLTNVMMPRCYYTNMGCATRTWPRRYHGTHVRHDEVATAAVVADGRASLELDDPGEYRLTAIAKLRDGSTVSREIGVAVREADALPHLVVSLEQAEVPQGGTLRGEVASRYADARALVVLRDATGIKRRSRVALTGGRARFDFPVDASQGYGTIVEAYVLGRGGAIHAAEQVVRVAQSERTLAIRTHAKDTYGPGEIVDLDVDVDIDRHEPVDLVVSVFDQALLGIAPDRAVDPARFYFADDRVRSRPAIGALHARLGDVTVGELAKKLRATVAKPRTYSDPPDLDFAPASHAVSILDTYGLDIVTLAALLNQAGVRTAISGHAWNTPRDEAARKRLPMRRLIDVLETDGKELTLELAGDTLVIGAPGRFVMPVATMPGAARGDAHFSVSGNATFSVPVENAPSPLEMRGTEVIRRDFSDSALFDGRARTDRDGKAHFRFKLPDSLTNWQIAVTAVGRDGRAGRHVAKFRTIRDIMVWPMIPRTFTEGDTVDVFATVHNLTAADRDIVVAIAADNADVLSPASVTVHVPRGKNRPVTWAVRAREPGVLTLTMAAALNGGEIADASRKRIPVVASAAEQVATASGFTTRPLALDLPPGIDPRKARLEITFAPTLAADMVASLDYLVEYPYGCAEQTMSRFAPAIEVARTLGNLGVKDGALAARLPSVVAGGLKHLMELQQPDGGWGWIGDATHGAHEMMTPYVVWGLLEAERAGYTIPNERALARGLARIRTFIEDSDKQLADRAYLMYVYSRRERLPDAWWNALVRDRGKLSDYALALALEMADARKDPGTAQRIVDDLHARAQRGGGSAYWRTAGFSRWGDDPLEITAAVLKALVIHDAADALVPEAIAYFVANKRGDHWNSTKDTAMILFAITEYLSRKGIRSGRDPFVEYAIDGGAPARVGFADGLVRTIVVDSARLSRHTAITFPSASPGMMARAVLRYHKAGRDLAPVADGLEVKRSLFLLGANGQHIRELVRGDRVARGAYVESVVTVTRTGGEPLRYVLVEDPKPAGAETIPEDDPRFARPARTWALREDRESKLAFHIEQAPASVDARSIFRLELAGELAIPPAASEMMYQTQIRGSSGSTLLRVD